MRDRSATGAGLVHVYTGDGKGKTTASLGLALRAAGHGIRGIAIQFLKGDADTGEHRFTGQHSAFKVVQFTEGNCFQLPEDQLRADVEKAFCYAEETIREGGYPLVVLDEVFVAVGRGMLDVDRLAALVRGKPDTVELVLTGRGAPPEIIELADYVTEMRAVKHPLSTGIKARQGIEY